PLAAPRSHSRAASASSRIAKRAQQCCACCVRWRLPALLRGAVVAMTAVTGRRRCPARLEAAQAGAAPARAAAPAPAAAVAAAVDPASAAPSACGGATLPHPHLQVVVATAANARQSLRKRTWQNGARRDYGA